MVNGFTVEQLDMPNGTSVVSMIIRSLEPMKVITLARLYGFAWSNTLTQCAAESRQYELLKWLLKCGCPWDPEIVLDQLVDNSDDLEHMQQLRAVTGPWPADQLATIMLYAGRHDNDGPETLNSLKWLREQGAAWPKSFYDLQPITPICWCVRSAYWALTNGSTWLEWRCQDLAPEHYYDCDSDVVESSDGICNNLYCDRCSAKLLFIWAHKNGCPCTCNEIAVA
jgi:hypothetical protein